jgi:serine-type D-Ala-D-Ala carboxypeptidase/endopeptidase (penicillin-binding protein 4)
VADPRPRPLLAASAFAVAVLAACTSTDSSAVPVTVPTSPTTERSPATSAALGTAVPTTVAALQPPPLLVQRLEPLWAAVPAGCAAVVVDGQPLFMRAVDAAAQPASLMKLFTAVAALDLLGSTSRLSTEVRGRIGTDGVVDGDLVLVGGGDPVLGTDAWARSELRTGRLHTSLDTLADGVAAAGVRHVRGAVLGDESRYDASRLVESWPQRLVDDGEIGPLSALTVNDGFETWGHPGASFADPARGAAELFQELLVARGVVIDEPAQSGVATEAPVIASVDSPPVDALVSDMLRESDNGTAELLVKEVGYRAAGDGSTTAGVAAVEAAIAARGVVLDGVVLADGSGLSVAARVTCRSLTSLLDRAAPVLRSSLALAGRSGTLRNRLVGTPAEGRVRAKTGTLNGISAIAGYADVDPGEVVFAFVGNGLPVPTRPAPFQDPFLLALFS